MIRPHRIVTVPFLAPALLAGVGLVLAGCATDEGASAAARPAPALAATGSNDDADASAPPALVSPENDRTRARREAWRAAIEGVAIVDGRLVVTEPRAGDPAAALAEAEALARGNQRTDAVAAAVLAVRATPRSADAFRTLATMLRDKGEGDFAEAARRSVIDLAADAPAEVRALDHVELGAQVARTRGREADVLAAYEEALAIDPGCGPAHRALAIRLVLLGELDAARPHADAAARAGVPVPPQLERRLAGG